MKNSKELFNELVARVALHDDLPEMQAIVALLLEKLFDIARSDIMAGKEVALTTGISRLIDGYVTRINNHEPVQYILGEAFFYGRIFKVDNSVLIPRPETEELVRTVLDWKQSQSPGGSTGILDIGTGSGCIAITLALEWPGAEVFGVDFSADALAVAKENARHHGAYVNFFHTDILNDIIPVTDLRVVVSNPPYIAAAESSSMHRRVLDFEPDNALFVPDDDPLIFYKAISVKAGSALNRGGLLALEINERFGREVCQLLRDDGWNDVKLIRDLSGKGRVVVGGR